MDASSSEPRPDTAPRRILLVDCDAFFVQVARLVDPDGAGRAELLIVGGSASGRGVVTSASYATRPYGVRSAMPTGQALRLCPEATVAPVPRAECARKAREIRDVLQRLSPVVQAASIDEFYLDLGGTERLFAGESLEDTAWRIRRTVLAETDISVSLGGGTRRIVAKLATRLAKPGGVHVVPPGTEAAFMRRFELADIPGVGPAMAESLRRKGLVTVDDALAVGPEWLLRWFGRNRGAWLDRRIRGLDRSEVDPREPRKSVSAERTFSTDIDDDQELERRLLGIAVSAGRHLRDSGLRARTVTVKLRDHDFTTRSKSRTLPEPLESDSAIYGVARGLLAELRRKRTRPARLLGVGLTHLVESDVSEQLGLFAGEVRVESDRERTVSRVVDDLRDRFGDEAVVPGGVLRGRPRGGGPSPSKGPRPASGGQGGPGAVREPGPPPEERRRQPRPPRDGADG